MSFGLSREIYSQNLLKKAQQVITKKVEMTARTGLVRKSEKESGGVMK